MKALSFQLAAQYSLIIVVKIPGKLYKYREFGVNAMRMLCEATVHYSDPRLFNDPLDCDPTLNKGVALSQFERLCIAMLEAEHKRNHPNDLGGHVAKARSRIDYFKYMATDIGDFKPGSKAERYYAQQLSSEIKRLLDGEMSPRGVLSLSADWNNSLMWSHYAGGHSGICLEFDTQAHQCQELLKVKYSPQAVVDASDLIEWKLHGCAKSKKSVFDMYYVTKACAWKYEREWRDISLTAGDQPMPFRLSGIYFGLKCDYWVRASIVKLLDGSTDEPRVFYEMVRQPGQSKLSRRRFEDDDISEMKATAIRSSPLLDFPPL